MNQLYQFPLELYQKTLQNRKQERANAIEEKQQWLKVRNALSIELQNELDESFVSTFEKLSQIYLNSSSFTEIEIICNKLIDLITSGASATLLDNNELGGYNLAKLVSDIVFLNYNEEQFRLILKTFRLSLLADAAVLNQKAYAGNGGAPIFYWLSLYFLVGLPSAKHQRKNMIHYSIYFQFYTSLIAFYPEAITQYDSPVYDITILPKENLFCPINLQLEFYFSIIFNLMSLPKDDYSRKLNIHHVMMDNDIGKDQHSIIGKKFFGQSVSNLVKNNLLSTWISILLPYPDKSISNYINYQMYAVAKEKLTIDYFKHSKQSRRLFKEYFTHSKHWFLDQILKNNPSYIFLLVKHAEFELLLPFCKNYPDVIRSLKNDKNESLLDIALLQKKPSQKIINKLRSMQVPILK
jgi:hypothetical protein